MRVASRPRALDVERSRSVRRPGRPVASAVERAASSSKRKTLRSDGPSAPARPSSRSSSSSVTSRSTRRQKTASVPRRPRSASDDRKREPAAQAELVACCLLLGVPVREATARASLSAGRKARELARGLLGREPERCHHRLLSGLGEDEHGRRGLTEPGADSSTRRSAPSIESEAPTSARRRSQCSSLRARVEPARSRRSLLPSLLRPRARARLGGVTAATEAGGERDRDSQQKCSQRGHADGDPRHGLPARQSTLPSPAAAARVPTCDCRNFSCRLLEGVSGPSRA